MAERPPRPRTALLTGATLLALATSCGPTATRPPRVEPTAPPTPAPPRPNIVLIITDDMDVSALPHMPILRARLTEPGLSFKNSFVVDPVCAPSRASILTGRYVHNHGLLDNRPPIGGYRKFVENDNESQNVALWLKAAGYRTGLIGKYLNRYPSAKDRDHVPPGWDDWHALFFPESYEEYLMNENGEVVPFGDKERHYLTDVLRSRALDFIQTTPPGQPFFLYLAPFAPHAPAQPATRHEKLFPGLEAPRPPSFNEEDVSGKPSWLRAQPRMSDETIQATDAWHRRRVQTLQAVDEMIGKVLQALEARHQVGNTYVFFTSDNGFQLGAHRLDHGKGDPYEESIRVPLVVRGPGIPAGRNLEHMVLNIDLAPTFVELAGGTPPEVVDGRSLLPLFGPIAPPEGEWRQDFLVEHWDYAKARERDEGRDTEGEGGIPEYAGLRTTQHLYVEYPDTNERELYDLKHDPYEMESLQTTARPGLVRRLAERLRVLKSCRGAACRQ